jgi:hypothetical protein
MMMIFGIDVSVWIAALIAICTTVVGIEKVYAWLKQKFDYAHNKVNQDDELKTTITKQAEELKILRTQNKIIMDGLMMILRNTIKNDGIKYIERGKIYQDELDEYEQTYAVYEQMGGNGIGKKYHNAVMDLPILKNVTKDN